MNPPTTAEVLRNILDRIKSGEESPEECVKYRHVAGEISAYGAAFAEALRKRNARRKSSPSNAAMDLPGDPNGPKTNSDVTAG